MTLALLKKILFWYNTPGLRFTILISFYVCSSVAFSMSTLLYHHYLRPLLEHFHLERLKLCTCTMVLHFPSPSPCWYEFDSSSYLTWVSTIIWFRSFCDWLIELGIMLSMRDTCIVFTSLLWIMFLWTEVYKYIFDALLFVLLSV